MKAACFSKRVIREVQHRLEKWYNNLLSRLFYVEKCCDKRRKRWIVCVIYFSKMLFLRMFCRNFLLKWFLDEEKPDFMLFFLCKDASSCNFRWLLRRPRAPQKSASNIHEGDFMKKSRNNLACVCALFHKFYYNPSISRQDPSREACKYKSLLCCPSNLE